MRLLLCSYAKPRRCSIWYHAHMQTLPAVLFLIEQTRRGGPLALLAEEGRYTLSCALVVILGRAGMEVELVEGSFHYQRPQTQSQSMGLYGVRLPAEEGGIFVSCSGGVGVEEAIAQDLAHWFNKGHQDFTWDRVKLAPGSVPAAEYLDDEYKRGDRPGRRAIPALLDKGFALLQAGLLQEQTPLGPSLVRQSSRL